MRQYGFPTTFFSLFFIGLLFASGLASSFLQAPQPSPTPAGSPSPSPSASPTITPVRTPSPTPLPGAQSFHKWGSVTVFNGLPSDSVRSIAQTSDGVMWFGTENGLARFDGRRIQNFSFGGSDANRITALQASATGELWIGTQTGAFIYSDGRFLKIEGAETASVTAILLDSENYLATEGGCVLRVVTSEDGRFKTEDLHPNPISKSDGSPLSITSLAKRNGKLLAGTSGGGVFVVEQRNASHFQVVGANPTVNSIVSVGQSVWLGTDAAKGAGGIYSIEAEARGRRVPAPTGTVAALAANEHGVWAASERYGLFHIANGKLKKTFTFENTSGGLRSDTIFTLFTDREGVLWIGTNRGVSRFDLPGVEQETVSEIPNSNFIRTLFRASDGTIYAGSNRGLFVKERDEWTQLTAYGNQPVYSITENLSKRLVVGTEAVGRRSFVADGETWIAGERGVFRERNGQSEKIIETDDVRDVFADGDQVWAATTTRGLLHARNDPRFGWLVSSTGFEQGMPSEKAFAILPLSEGLLIGTNRGVVKYKPATIAPTLIVTRILSQRAHDISEARFVIPLEYPQNSLLVEVAGQSSRTFPEEFQYAFVLTNANGDELDRRLSNDSQYAPTDLAAGDYGVEAIAFNRDLVASEPIFIRFSVARAPFPWTATALGALLVLALIGLAWAVIEHRRIKTKNSELAAARFDLANETERERRRIARDLHDQTLADLRKLMMMSDELPVEGASFRSEIESVSSEVRHICEDLSPSVLENVGLTPALEFLLDNTIENNSFSASDELEERMDLSVNVQLQIYRIAQEVLSNIKNHSDAGLVEMIAEVLSDGAFVLTIKDDGRPFAPDGATRKGRGVANIKARASLINAKISWRERRKGGNSFTLTLNAKS